MLNEPLEMLDPSWRSATALSLEEASPAYCWRSIYSAMAFPRCYDGTLWRRIDIDSQCHGIARDPLCNACSSSSAHEIIGT